MLKFSRLCPISLKNCSWALPNYPVCAPHANWLLLFLHTRVSVVWRRSCRQLIYSRAILKGHAPAPEVINLPNQPICERGQSDGGVSKDLWDGQKESCKYSRCLRTFCFSTSVIWTTPLLSRFLRAPLVINLPSQYAMESGAGRKALRHSQTFHTKSFTDKRDIKIGQSTIVQGFYRWCWIEPAVYSRSLIPSKLSHHCKPHSWMCKVQYRTLSLLSQTGLSVTTCPLLIWVQLQKAARMFAKSVQNRKTFQ